MLIQNFLGVNKVYFGNVKVANYDWGQNLSPKTVPQWKSTLRLFTIQTLCGTFGGRGGGGVVGQNKWPTTFLNVSTENFREKRNIWKGSAALPKCQIPLWDSCFSGRSVPNGNLLLIQYLPGWSISSKPSFILFSSLRSSFSVTGTDCTNSKGRKSSGTKFNSAEFCLVT